jgi:ABC-2 type transport system ATP-binding protein
MREAALEATALVQRFGQTSTLSGLSLRLEPGELYGLVGPDGAGKTSTLRLFAGLARPVSGTIRVEGQDPSAPRSRVRESLGYMPQRYALYGDLSVAENLRFFARLYGVERSAFLLRRARLLAITRLEPFVDRRADQLSGGMYKKLALACALLHAPHVLLLDEPTNGVDPTSRLELWDLLAEFVAEGMAVLVTTSYMDEAERCARVGLLDHGRLLVEGPPADLVSGFHGVVATLTGPIERVEALLPDLGDDLVASTPRGQGLRVVLEPRALPSLEAAARVAGVQLDRARPTFEDLFLELIHAEDREAA